MALMQDVAQRLLTNPKPVLFLDTCEFINVLDAIPENRIGRLETAMNMLESFTLNPDLLQIVVSELVLTEWQQNIFEKEKALLNFLELVDQRISSVRQAWALLKKPLAFSHPEYREPALAAHVSTLANNLLRMAEVIDFDDDCKNLAFARVINKKRPARKGQLKDALIIEHYLQLSSRLKGAGFPFRRAFVTSNFTDFSLITEDKNKNRNTDQLHPDLEPDFANCGMEYFVDLRAAYEQLSRDPVPVSLP